MNLKYAEQINKHEIGGLVDVSTCPPTIFCYCSKEVSEIILKDKSNSEKFNKLGEDIARCYVDENGDELEEEESMEMDLGTIGEIAAEAYGWL